MVAIRVRYHQIGSAGLSCPCRSCTASTTAAGAPAQAMISTDSTRSLCGASPRLAAELAGCPLYLGDKQFAGMDWPGRERLFGRDGSGWGPLAPDHRGRAADRPAVSRDPRPRLRPGDDDPDLI